MCLVAFAVALLCSVSGSRSSPVACEDLLRPLDRQDLRHLEGQWAVVAASLSHLPDLEQFKQRESAAVTYSRNHSDSNISYTRSIVVENRCLYATFNISLQGGGFTFDGTAPSILSAHFVRTCRDCTLMRIDWPLEKKTNLYLFSRRRAIGQQEMEEFRAQVQCLDMPPPVVMDPEKELCPAETTAAQSDNFANSSDSSKLSFTCAFNFGGNCRYLHCNISLVGGSFALNNVNVTVTFLFTSCPDCLAMHFDNQASKVRRLYLFSRRREVEPREMEELQDQSRCLNMIPPVVMDPTKELCLKGTRQPRDTRTQTLS